MKSARSVSTTGRTLRLFWDIAAKSPMLLAIGIIGPVFAVGVGQFAGPLFVALLLDQIQQGEASWDNSWPLVAGYFSTQVLGVIIGWRITLYAAWTFQVRGMRLIFQRVFSHLTHQSMGFHADRFSGALVSQTTKLVGAFELFWDTVTWTVMPIITGVLTSTLILSFVLWPYAIFLLVMSLTFIGAVFIGTRYMERLTVAEAAASNRQTGFLADVMTNIAAVKAQASERQERHTSRMLATERMNRDLDVMRSFLKFSAGYATVMTLLNTGAVVAAVFAAQYDLVSIGAVYLAVTYTLTVSSQLWEVNAAIRNYNRVVGDAHEMVEILHSEPAVTDRPHAQDLVVSAGAVDVNQIRFGHEEDASHPLFDDFSVHIAAGEKVGLVGHSGSGKTTLTRLLLRFADVQDGSICIDGQDISAVTQASLRQAISYVSQEPLLFHRTLRENIAYSRPGASDEQVRVAAEKAYALDFIDTLPQGMQTTVGERGVKLSGGQRQRIAIARAILKDAPILVLDEATSALDSESESHIQAALAQAMAGRTTLVIAHRLSTVQLMDRILVMEVGRIVEQGSHRDLLTTGGVYADLWSHQSGGFLN